MTNMIETLTTSRKKISAVVLGVFLFSTAVVPQMYQPGLAFKGFGAILDECIPSTSGNGRAMMFDGISLYYTLSGGATIFKVDTDCVPVSSCASVEGAIGALTQRDPADGKVWAGAYDGTNEVWKLDPDTCATVVPPFVATHGGVTSGDIFDGFIDGIALDTSDGTLWYSTDEATHIHHISTANVAIGTCSTPPPIGMVSGMALNSGIEYNPVQDNLIVALFTSINGAPRSIAEVTKADSGTCTKIAEFDTGAYIPEDLALDTSSFPATLGVWSNEATFGDNRLRLWEVKQLEVEVEKFYTFTDKEVDPITECDLVSTPDGICITRPRTVEEASLGTPLPKDEPVPPGTGKFLLKAVIKKDGTVASYNPGQYYAVTKVTLGSDLSMLWITELFGDCTETTMISVVNPDKDPAPDRATGTLEVVLIRDGLVFDISSDVASAGGLFLTDSDGNGVIDNAEAHLDGLKAGDMILFYVKFGPGLKGTTFPTPDPMCENKELVKAMLNVLTLEKSATAGLIVRPK